MMLRAFVLFSLQAAAVQAKRSSVSSLEDLGSFIAVVYAAVLMPLLGYFLYNVARDPATGQVLRVMWARIKQRTFAFLGPSPESRSTATQLDRQPVIRAAMAAESKKGR
ncbi:hypothetical protein PRNP1_008902 [Phytophthora ramorum]